MALTKTAAALLVVGLVIGVVAGYGVGFITYQPQISRLQSDLSETQASLSETQSALSESQSEVDSLRGQLTEATDKLATTEAELTGAQTTITSLETQLTESETKYTTLSSEYEEFNSDVTSLVNSLEKKLDLGRDINELWIRFERGTITLDDFWDFTSEDTVDAIGDSELSATWDEMIEALTAEDYALWDRKFAALMEKLNTIIQSDLSKLDTILAS